MEHSGSTVFLGKLWNGRRFFRDQRSSKSVLLCITLCIFPVRCFHICSRFLRSSLREFCSGCIFSFLLSFHSLPGPINIEVSDAPTAKSHGVLNPLPSSLPAATVRILMRSASRARTLGQFPSGLSRPKQPLLPLAAVSFGSRKPGGITPPISGFSSQVDS